MKRKKIYTAIAGTLLLILYIVIFCFSAEDGESSSAISTRVTLALYKLYYGVTGYEGGSQIVANAVALPLEGFIRKLGHFLEYFCMGFLSYSIAFMWMKSRFKGYIMIVVQLFLSAGADERACGPADEQPGKGGRSGACPHVQHAGGAGGGSGQTHGG